MKILISGGGTIVPIDEMRFIANRSTGKTAFELAKTLAIKHDVTLVTSNRSNFSTFDGVTKFYDTYEDLYNVLKSELENDDYDVIVHSAAVSDFLIDSVENSSGVLDANQKIPSSEPLIVKLRPSEKIVGKLKEWSKKSVKVIAFKLTSDVSEIQKQEAIKKVVDVGADWLVYNKISEVKDNEHSFEIYNNKLEQRSIGATKLELGYAIDKLLGECI